MKLTIKTINIFGHDFRVTKSQYAVNERTYIEKTLFNKLSYFDSFKNLLASSPVLTGGLMGFNGNISSLKNKGKVEYSVGVKSLLIDGDLYKIEFDSAVKTPWYLKFLNYFNK